MLLCCVCYAFQLIIEVVHLVHFILLTTPMALDYKSSAYKSYLKRDPSGQENEKRTTYGRMNNWQREKCISTENILNRYSVKLTLTFQFIFGW